ncbi:unnamed protein product [Rodentolepis nana]|uniref:Protein-tyrosine-phosphatase n=1 Tax=Rodentolepis nana TaxID=102285 RepID=A0A158QHJ9_RODNA|nr:unnamed protein product [Rodentolepis nana]
MIVPVVFCLLFSVSGQQPGQGFYSRNAPSNWILEKNSMTRKNSQARINQPPQDAAVLEGEDALFFCGVEGSPEPIVKFLLDGQSGKLSGETGKVIPLDGGGGSLLRLFKVSTRQNGIKVECFASNHVGNDKASAELKVYKYSDHVPSGFPKFVRPPQAQSVDAGKRLQLQCEAEGTPDLKFIWLKNEIPIKFNQQRLQALGYRGRYSYDASYDGSNIDIKKAVDWHCETVLTCIDSLSTPTILTESRTLELYWHRATHITRLLGVPLGQIVDSIGAGQRYKLGSMLNNKTFQLILGEIYGIYKDLKVRQLKMNTFYPPTIIEQQDKVEVRPGKGANLTCTATGNPKPQVKWLTDQEKPLTEAVDWKAILFLIDVTEPRDYICVANNSLGRVQHLVRVEIIDVPRAPVDLQVVERGPTFAILRWFPSRIDDDNQPDPTRPPPVPITSYTLIVTDLDADNGRQAKKRKITGISPRKIEADGYIHQKVLELKPDHRYTAEVYALGAQYGISDVSNQVTFKTLELPPSGPLLSIRATATSSDSISVSWKPPAEPNGKIIGYKVYYSTHLRNKLEQWQVIQTNKPHAVLKGLSYMATYYIRVSAFNSAGDGPLSDALPIIVNPGVPPQPLNFRGVSPSPTSIQLIWSPPELPHGMTILDYQLQCRPASEISATTLPQTPLAISIPAKHTGWTIKSLQSDTLYQVVLTARTQHGLGVPAKLEIRTLSNRKLKELVV